jgi:cephalosporin-C deacetylase-like acetyl esterase
VNAKGESKANNFPLKEVLNEKYGRSTSFDGIRVVYHNTGYWNNKGQPHNADPQFEHTAAHEFGHLILNVYGAGSSPDYSWSHKGTSTVISQSPLPGTSYPATGEVDLMKYTENSQLPGTYRDYWDRSIAAGQNVKSLLWLVRVEFK